MARACTSEHDRRLESDRAIEALCRAARCWTAPDIVTDVRTHSGSLHTACTDLQSLGRPDGVVRLLLTCAANFRRGGGGVGGGGAAGLHDADAMDVVPPGEGPGGGAAGFVGMEEAARWAAEGLGKGKAAHSEVEIENARHACWDLVIETLANMSRRPEVLVNTATAPGQSLVSLPVERQQELADEAVGQALVSPDWDFHSSLYQHLFDNDKPRLVRINSDYVKDWFDGAAIQARKEGNYPLETELYTLQHKYYHDKHRQEGEGGGADTPSARRPLSPPPPAAQSPPPREPPPPPPSPTPHRRHNTATTTTTPTAAAS